MGTTRRVKRIINCSIGRTSGAVALAIVSAGCAAQWHAASPEYYREFDHGFFQAAADQALHCAHDCVPEDRLIFGLDAGVMLRAAGDVGQSDSQLNDARLLVGEFDKWPDVRVSEEVASALGSTRSRAYRGTLSDLVMICTYMALDEMEMGRTDNARNRLIDAAFVQQRVAEKYAKAIQQAAADGSKQSTDNPVDTARTLREQQKSDAELYKGFTDLRPYADFVNPFCDYVQGIYFMGAALDRSDQERAVTAFKRAASMEPGNGYIKQDVADAEAFADGNPLSPITYVIFETGTAPALGQIKVTLPVFLADRRAPTVALFFPTISPTPPGSFVPALDVTAGDRQMRTALVSDMDSVALREFKASIPTVMTRMVVAAATKAAADAGIRQGLSGTPFYVQILYSIASLVYQDLANQADLRSCQAMPKQFQVARFPTPADGIVRLTPGDFSGPVTVKLNPGRVNVVYAKSVHVGVPLVVRQFVVGGHN